MNRVSRRGIVLAAGSGLAMPAISRYARAAEYTWRIGHVAPVNTPLHKNMMEAAEAIAKRSDGRMELKVLGEGKAGIQSGLLAQVRNGGIEMTVVSATQLAPTIVPCAIPATGFLFGGRTGLWQAMDGELGEFLRATMSRQLGVEVFEKVWDFGFRHITTFGKSITKPEDLSGLKIRTQIDSDQMDLFRALNAVPIVITLPYLRAALEHKQLDGQEGMLPVVQYARLNEVQTHCAMTHHIWDGLWLCANPAAWKALPERLQRIVSNTMNGAAARQREESAQMEKDIRETLSKGGMIFTEVNQAGFREVLRRKGYYSQIKAKVGEQAWAAVKKSTGVDA